MRAADRRGFTLLELLVALAIGGVVVAGARGLLEGLAASAGSTAVRARALDARWNAERRAREVAVRMTVRDDSAGAFEGTALDARFETWCDMPEGWQEACTARLAARHTPVGMSVGLSLSTGDSLTLRAGAHDAHLIYLASAALGGAWRDAWAPSLVTPLAIGVVADADTLLLRMGARP